MIAHARLSREVPQRAGVSHAPPAMSKLNDRLTLAANLSVVASIIFLAVQMAQNTRAIESQTRDSITEKEMEYYGWLANDRRRSQGS